MADWRAVGMECCWWVGSVYGWVVVCCSSCSSGALISSRRLFRSAMVAVGLLVCLLLLVKVGLQNRSLVVFNDFFHYY